MDWIVPHSIYCIIFHHVLSQGFVSLLLLKNTLLDSLSITNSLSIYINFLNNCASWVYACVLAKYWHIEFIWATRGIRLAVFTMKKCSILGHFQSVNRFCHGRRLHAALLTSYGYGLHAEKPVYNTWHSQYNSMKSSFSLMEPFYLTLLTIRRITVSWISMTLPVMFAPRICHVGMKCSDTNSKIYCSEITDQGYVR